MNLIIPELRRNAVVDGCGSFESNDTCLRLIKVDDAEFTLKLRLDPTRNKHLSAVSNDLEEQRRWISSYKEREFMGSEFYFIVEHSRIAVGTVRIYDFLSDSFCWGSWVIEPGTSVGVSLASAYLVYKLGFDALGFGFSHFDVRKENRSVNRFHQRMGAVFVRHDLLNNYYSIDRNDVVAYFAKHRLAFNH